MIKKRFTKAHKYQNLNWNENENIKMLNKYINKHYNSINNIKITFGPIL